MVYIPIKVNKYGNHRGGELSWQISLIVSYPIQKRGSSPAGGRAWVAGYLLHQQSYDNSHRLRHSFLDNARHNPDAGRRAVITAIITGRCPLLATRACAYAIRVDSRHSSRGALIKRRARLLRTQCLIGPWGATSPKLGRAKGSHVSNAPPLHYKST